jgi:hypothetical protein
LWDEIAAEVAKDFPDVTWDKELVDAMTFRMVAKPKSIDTVVATNLHADILSDLAAALAGSLGIAPTGNIDPERRFPSMFEPIHGSAFDITGKGVANPVASFWTGGDPRRLRGSPRIELRSQGRKHHGRLTRPGFTGGRIFMEGTRNGPDSVGLQASPPGAFPRSELYRRQVGECR